MSATDPTPDLTLAVTAHNETAVAGPTFASAEAAVAEVRALGLTVELLIGMDTPTPECRTYMTQPALTDWQVSEHAFRDQGKTRNALATQARGRWLAFLDADDLISENWLSAAITLLQTAPAQERLIVHPELTWQFDAAFSVYAAPGQDDALFSPHALAVANMYDALCLAPRQVWLDHPYPDRDIPAGYAFEDWQWAIETMAAGWQHVVARDTVIFKRRRDASQTHQAKARAATVRPITPLAIDQLSALGYGAGRTETE